ncbi:LEA type 2 family protein [Oleiharenicola lentus]|uniref:LEA type 2 family protein n=1 Tax=Oleiharenicola lentus TaxID=2508720 RepID=UPI003F680A0F
MKNLLSRSVLGMGVVLAFAGCASMVNSEQARLSLINVRPAASTVFETSVELTLRLTNETNQTLQLSGSSHKLELNGSNVGRGVSSESITVPPLGTTTVNVTMYLENLTLLRKFSDVQNLSQVSYQLDSRLFSTGGRTLPVRTEGTFDLRPFTQGLNRR